MKSIVVLRECRATKHAPQLGLGLKASMKFRHDLVMYKIQQTPTL